MKRGFGFAGLLALVAGAAAATVQVRDDAGHTLALAQPARRIVSLAPHLTELLFAAGAGPQVVATDAYSDYPAAARALPRIGDAALLDLERVVALRPDLVVVWLDGNAPRQLERLAALHIPVYASRLATLGDIASTLRRLGHLAGHDAAAEARVRAFERELGELRETYAGRRELRVFYPIWPRPLMTVNDTHLISQSLRLCGARNVFGALAPLTPSVDEEAVVNADPDVIAAGSADPSAAADFAPWRRLKTLRATRLNDFVAVDPDTLHRSSDRIVVGIRELCRKLDAIRQRLPPP